MNRRVELQKNFDFKKNVKSLTGPKYTCYRLLVLLMNRTIDSRPKKLLYNSQCLPVRLSENFLGNLIFSILIYYKCLKFLVHIPQSNEHLLYPNFVHSFDSYALRAI